MDLNDLYQRHQISLINAKAAANIEARAAHMGLASLYAVRINAVRQRMQKTKSPAFLL
ncbi:MULTISPECIES: hypothetical protein [unclassified Sphingomonas]|uniref:hypothetical protein n=1 Tax=unclassified Sphingomonas TaxID=196159 RepID=UPI000ABD0C8F|nr:MULTISPECIES: hypothetical protein [unclassified Sphingomonas]